MSKQQKGFALLETTLILVILIVISGVAWYALHTKHQTDKILSQADKISQTAPTNQKTSTVSGKAASQQYLDIKEWGIKVKLGSADPAKVTYTLSGPAQDPMGPNTGSAHLSLASTVTSNALCQDLGIAIVRRDTDVNPLDKKLGSNWYGVVGSPYACGSDQLDSLRQQYAGNNPSTWEYSLL